MCCIPKEQKADFVIDLKRFLRQLPDVIQP